MKIKHLNTDQKIIIVAEIGNNHEGNFDVAIQLINQAAQAGADCVKFQTITPELLVTEDQKERLDKLKSFQFSIEQFMALKKHADSRNVLFFSTPFDLPGVQKLSSIQEVYKIASSDNTFWPLIEAVAQENKPTLISTGCLNMDGVEDLVSRWTGSDKNLALLHCVSAYPVPNEQANLGAIIAMKKRFPDITIGYSDHTLGIDTALHAAALGARIIEKHFTLDHNYSEFRDHQLSANPQELSELADKIKRVPPMKEEDFDGAISKDIQSCENENISAIRRSIAARKDLHKGHVISLEDLCWLRPGTHLPPGSENQVIGKTANSFIKRGKVIDLSNVI